MTAVSQEPSNEPREAEVVLPLSELDKVEAWILEQFVKQQGFSVSMAEMMLKMGVDHHETDRLLRMGRDHRWVYRFVT